MKITKEMNEKHLKKLIEYTRNDTVLEYGKIEDILQDKDIDWVVKAIYSDRNIVKNQNSLLYKVIEKNDAYEILRVISHSRGLGGLQDGKKYWGNIDDLIPFLLNNRKVDHLILGIISVGRGGNQYYARIDDIIERTLNEKEDATFILCYISWLRANNYWSKNQDMIEKLFDRKDFGKILWVIERSRSNDRTWASVEGFVKTVSNRDDIGDYLEIVSLSRGEDSRWGSIHELINHKYYISGKELKLMSVDIGTGEETLELKLFKETRKERYEELKGILGRRNFD